MLERLDPNTQTYEAKRGAAVGVFQMVVAGKEEVCHAMSHDLNYMTLQTACRVRKHSHVESCAGLGLQQLKCKHGHSRVVCAYADCTMRPGVPLKAEQMC